MVARAVLEGGSVSPKPLAENPRDQPPLHAWAISYVFHGSYSYGVKSGCRHAINNSSGIGTSCSGSAVSASPREIRREPKLIHSGKCVPAIDVQYPLFSQISGRYMLMRSLLFRVCEFRSLQVFPPTKGVFLTTPRDSNPRPQVYEPCALTS